MRIWSIHPKYLDSKGLVALWREVLLAKAVLSGRTKAYQHHPQLARFIQSAAPKHYLAAYMKVIYAEAARRKYHFDETKIDQVTIVPPLSVTKGQIEYEWIHLKKKLEVRSPSWLQKFQEIRQPLSHPIFCVVEGAIEPWEVIAKM